MKYILLITLLIFLIILGPLLIIWSLNTLFPLLAIPYTWETWLAVVFIGSLFKTTVKVNK
jgi:hypothetical protein